MDRLVINIETEELELSIYHHDDYSEFDIYLATDDGRNDFEMSDDNAKKLADAILTYLDNKR